MPIPMKNERAECESPEDFIRLYKEYGWSRAFKFNWIDWDSDGRIAIVTHYEFDGNQLRCNCDGANQQTVGQLRPSGIIGHCMKCRGWTGSISMELCKNLGSRVVSIGEAYKVLDRTHQRTPIGFPRKNKKSKLLGWA